MNFSLPCFYKRVIGEVNKLLDKSAKGATAREIGEHFPRSTTSTFPGGWLIKNGSLRLLSIAHAPIARL